MKLSSNTLYIVSTPIGNLDDITLRAIQVLKESDIILCEDTRRSSKLLNHLKIKKQLISYHKFNEKKQLNNIIEHIKKGKILSLISDAGTPLLSDPGRLLLNECLIREIKIVPIPGVSSIATAMSVSGFSDKFLFYGFLPKKLNELTRVLDVLSKYEYSQVFFVPALKANFYINEIKKFYSGRRLMIAKEITKIHEEFIRLDLDNFKTLKSPLKGELTFIISNMDLKEKTVNEEKIINKAKKYLKKYSVKDTVDLIMETEQINKKMIYQICLKIKNEINN
ncbi:16S rRNA (cytidine(1402)-2'-O)-methyltransferase [Candidatus Pelagibacter bacterium]|nr:16S rRNA (cytidine(1402)-2'-O)-methyltransferase [Candidatus Pelagibacter bacterium]